MSEPKAMNCIKVVLKSGKEVILREMKMKYQTLALQAVGNKAKDNQLLAGALMLQELMKILLVQINGAKPTPQSLENLDELFSYSEIQQIQSVMSKIMGGDEDMGELKTEFVAIGGN